VTLPLILAREHDKTLATVKLREITTPRQAGDLCARIEATGALAEAKERALAIVAEAKADLVELHLEDGQRRALDLVADSVVDRHA
jgi:geranylgeranyl pyrophosphate synthase